MAADSSHLAPSPPLIGRQVGLVPVGHLRKGHSLGPSARVATSMGSISAQLPQPRMASSNSKRPRDCFGRSARYVAELEPTPDAAAGQPVQQITVSALHQHPVTISACTDVRGRHTGAGPGPGSYNLLSSPLWTSESVSRQGYTAGFHSRAPRLSSQWRYTGPGPGSYECPAPSASSRFHDSPRTVISVPATTESMVLDSVRLQRRLLQRVQQGNSLGPGYYEPSESKHGQRLSWTSLPGQRSAFVTAERAKWAARGADQDLPAPGTYELCYTWGAAEAARTNFKLQPSHSPPRVRPMARRIPQVVEADPGSREARALAVAAQQADDLKPGPGTYETQDLRGITSGLQAAAGRPSAAFGCQVVPQDRFSRPLQPRVLQGPSPAPGTYDAAPDLDFANSKKGTSAAFLSHVSRTSKSTVLHRPPGPAYYMPHAQADSKSHHLVKFPAAFVPAGAACPAS